MKQKWSPDELMESWSLSSAEMKAVSSISIRWRLAFALQLKHLEIEGHFAVRGRAFASAVIDYVAAQLQVDAQSELDPPERTAKRHRSRIREHLGYREFGQRDHRDMRRWLTNQAIDREPRRERLVVEALEWCRERRVEPPGPWRLDRILGGALRAHEKAFFEAVDRQLCGKTKGAIDALLSGSDPLGMTELRHDPGRASLETAKAEVAKLRAIRKLGLAPEMFTGLSTKVLHHYRSRLDSEPPSRTLERTHSSRYALVAIYCWLRHAEVIDSLVELVILTVHKLSTKAEQRVDQELFREIWKVKGKNTLLFRVAEASLASPDGTIRDVVFPLVGEDRLRALVEEYRANGPGYTKKIHGWVRSSYSRHYRRMLPLILVELDFRSNNKAHRPVLDALEILRQHQGSQGQFYLLEAVPVEGIVPKKLAEILLETGPKGEERINRINYEICVVQALRAGLRCKEIWVAGADRYRNPDQDLPQDFETRRERYYSDLCLPLNAEDFCNGLQSRLSDAVAHFAERLPNNPKVRLSEGTKHPMVLTPFDPLPEPSGLAALKTRVSVRWPNTSLLDVLKEADLRIGFTQAFRSTASRQALSAAELQRRLLLCLYGLGTNTGLKRISASGHAVSYKELLHVRHRFVHRPALREAIARVANAVFEARRPAVWGQGTTSCASDGKKFGAWDQNLMTEWHIRYGGRGVMIYWHVDKKSTCIYSQLERCSSSEVAAMIEGVLRHCTRLDIDRQFVDSKGQSEVAFAFCHLLGFELLPRLKNIQAQKLYLASGSDRERCRGLGPILARPIRWQLIHDQYDEMVKFTTALQQGTAEPESILRRFTRDNASHPTYQALKELGRAVKTLFVCVETRPIPRPPLTGAPTYPMIG